VIRERRRRFIKSEYLLDILDRKLLGLAAVHNLIFDQYK
jgi:hypothetical protein